MVHEYSRSGRVKSTHAPLACLETNLFSGLLYQPPEATGTGTHAPVGVPLTTCR